MSTDKPKIQGYISHDSFKRFNAWEEEYGIKGESEALNRLISEFFGLDSAPSTSTLADIDERVISIVNARLDAFQGQINALSEQVVSLAVSVKEIQSTSKLLGNLSTSGVINNLLGSTKSAILNGSKHQDELLSDLPSRLPTSAGAASISALTTESTSELLGVSLEVSADPEVTISRSEKSEDTVSELKSNIRSNLPTEDLAVIQETSLEVEAGNQAPGASPVKKLELPIGAGLTREEFLQRLKVKNPKLNETTVWRNREGKEKDYTKNRNHFLEWTKQNDPLGCSWEYRCALSINQPSYFRVA